MSWLFSQALAVEYSGEDCLDGAQCALLSAIPTPPASWFPDKTTEHLMLSRSGMTCARLTEDRGEALLTSYLAAFRARTSASPEDAKASTEKNLDSGARWLESSVKFDPDSYSWRTHQQLFDEVLQESSVILPFSGMMRGGVVYQPWNLERHTDEIDSGSLLPTPTAMQYGTTNNGTRSDGTTFATAGMPSLQTMAAQNLWPTPTVEGNRNRKGLSEKSGDGLETAVKRLEDQNGGPLNPTWVEWLMGWPIGWTSCDVLATDKFHRWQQKHGNY